MPEATFRVRERFREFFAAAKSPPLWSKSLVVYFVIWLVSFIISFYPTDFSLIFGTWVFYNVQILSWFKLVYELNKKIRFPTELLIAAFFLLFLFELPILTTTFDPTPFVTLAVNVFQGVLLAMLVLIFSLIVIQNNAGKIGALIWLVLIGLLVVNLLKSDISLFLLLAQILLFIFLLRRTAWLEQLTKQECWIYLFVLLALYTYFSDLNPFLRAGGRFYEGALIWHGLPELLFYSFRMYLLAVLIKIPIVLVYNFASLSGKLKISSFFQSTIPQFIQLCMLLIIFYFFIAGWQAEKVRRAMLNSIEQISSGKSTESIKILKIPGGDSDGTLRLKDYQPIDLSAKLPDEGVLLLQRDPSTQNSKEQPDFFLFFRSKEAETLYWYLVKLDSTFLQAVSNNTSILAGSVLLAYPYQPPLWESYLYELAIWKEDRKFRIFPFGLIARQNQQAITVPLTQQVSVSAEWLKKVNEQLASRHQFNIGRVVAPVIDANLERAGFYAFDILVIPDLSFFSTTMVSYLLFLGLIYFLANVVITRRMVKFGSEINRMIVQKFGQLRTGIREISTGNLDYKVKVEGKDEFVELAERFNQMGDKLKESIAKAREKERLEYELRIARQVQLELLPRALPEIPRFEIAATLKTANEVGGDFYDVVPLDNEKYLFTIGDVSGKGMSAAFYMAQCVSLIRYSQQFTHNPREIALRLNKYFGDPMIDRQIFVTATLGLLTVKTSTVEMVRAGHTPPIFIPGRVSSDIREVLCEGLGIGLERNGGLFEKNLATITLKLETGDTLVFYTDGLVEAARDALKTEPGKKDGIQFYSEERLRDKLNQWRGKKAAEYLQALTEDIEQFYSGSPPVDDYTLLLIQKTK